MHYQTPHHDGDNHQKIVSENRKLKAIAGDFECLCKDAMLQKQNTMSICKKCLIPRIISSANKSTTQNAILHLIFTAAQILVQAGFGGGSPALAITVELSSAVL